MNTILYEEVGRIALITLNRPNQLNAVNVQMTEELGKVLENFSLNPNLWVAIITGSGDKAFCAGADLKEFAQGKRSESDSYKKWGFAGLVNHFINKPIIAAVNGLALGGGTEIALACDLIIASDKAKFGLPEVKRGIVAGGGGLLRLPRKIPLNKALEIIMLGESISASEGERLGLVNKVVPHDKLIESALGFAEKINENGPLAIRASKKIVYEGLDLPLDFPSDAWRINKKYVDEILQTEDAKEGPLAFVEKRKPEWKGY